MFHLMAYSKDQDRYDERASGTFQTVKAEAILCQSLLRGDALRDTDGEPYDWLEIWDDEDDNGQEDVIVSPHELFYDMADCCMIVRDFEIGSSKGELTIDKLAQKGTLNDAV